MELCACWNLRSGCLAITYATMAASLFWIAIFGWQTAVVNECNSNVVSMSNDVEACYRMPNACPCNDDVGMYKYSEALIALFVVQLINVVVSIMLFGSTFPLLYGIHKNSKRWFWPWLVSAVLCMVSHAIYCLTWWFSGILRGYWIFLSLLALVSKFALIYAFLCVCAYFKKIPEKRPKFYYEFVPPNAPLPPNMYFKEESKNKPLVVMFDRQGTPPNERRVMAGNEWKYQGLFSDPRNNLPPDSHSHHQYEKSMLTKSAPDPFQEMVEYDAEPYLSTSRSIETPPSLKKPSMVIFEETPRPFIDPTRRDLSDQIASEGFAELPKKRQDALIFEETPLNGDNDARRDNLILRQSEPDNSRNRDVIIAERGPNWTEGENSQDERDDTFICRFDFDQLKPPIEQKRRDVEIVEIVPEPLPERNYPWFTIRPSPDQEQTASNTRYFGHDIVNQCEESDNLTMGALNIQDQWGSTQVNPSSSQQFNDNDRDDCTEVTSTDVSMVQNGQNFRQDIPDSLKVHASTEGSGSVDNGVQTGGIEGGDPQDSGCQTIWGGVRPQDILASPQDVLRQREKDKSQAIETHKEAKVSNRGREKKQQTKNRSQRDRKRNDRSFSGSDSSEERRGDGRRKLRRSSSVRIFKKNRGDSSRDNRRHGDNHGNTDNDDRNHNARSSGRWHDKYRRRHHSSGHEHKERRHRDQRDCDRDRDHEKVDHDHHNHKKRKSSSHDHHDNHRSRDQMERQSRNNHHRERSVSHHQRNNESSKNLIPNDPYPNDQNSLIADWRAPHNNNSNNASYVGNNRNLVQLAGKYDADSLNSSIAASYQRQQQSGFQIPQQIVIPPGKNNVQIEGEYIVNMKRRDKP